MIGVTCFQHGVFATEDDHYVIEHLLNGGRAADGYDHIVYKKSAIKSKHNESHCGVEGTLIRLRGYLVCIV